MIGVKRSQNSTSSGKRVKSGGMASSRGPSKIVIKPFKVKPSIPADFEEVTWKRLQTAVRAVQREQPTACSLETLYRACEDMCVHKMSSRLYDNLVQECDSHAGRVVAELSSMPVDTGGYLSTMNQAWTAYCAQMLDVRSICLYLDRTYAIQSPPPHVKPLWDMGLHRFREHMLKSPGVLQKTVNAILETIEMERNGEAVDKVLLKSSLRMLISLQLYHSHFHNKLVVSTLQYYRNESRRLLPDLELPKYLQNVEQRLDEEARRGELYFDTKSRASILVCTEKELVTSHVETLLGAGFEDLMNEARVEDLSRLHRLLQCVNMLDSMLAALKAFIFKIGTAILADDDATKSQITELVDFRVKQDMIIDKALGKDKLFLGNLKETWERVMNARVNQTAEMLAKYVDAKLRKGEKGGKGGKGGDEELELVLDQVMSLFRHLQAKDVFEAFYRKDLAKRLIMHRYASIDAENSMIAKLKNECGNTYTANLEHMFKDIEVSRDFMNSFNEMRKLQIKDVILEVKVLTTNFWPTYPTCAIRLPKRLEEYQQVFQRFYLSQHNGRCLKWQYSLGGAELLASAEIDGKQKTKVIVLSTYAAVCLLLFNERESMTFVDIRDALGMDPDELRLTLQSLACGKTRALRKEPPSKDVSDTDVFSVNKPKLFGLKVHRVKISNIQVRETQEEVSKTHNEVFQDRLYQVDAAIVRIMKTRKTLSHTMLVAQLFSQLKFPVKTADLKRRIESLMEREYLERDSAQKNTYNYLA